MGEWSWNRSRMVIIYTLFWLIVNCSLHFFMKTEFWIFLIKVLNWAVRIFLACRLVHLPMTKASVRAMDVITDFLTSPSSPQEIQDLQSSPRFYEVQTRLHLEVRPSWGCQISMQGPQLCAEPHHFCKLDFQNSLFIP